MMIENKKFRMEVNKEGCVSNLTMKDDPYQMNWMIEDSYLQEKNYKDADKLFGFFELIAVEREVWKSDECSGFKRNRERD